MTKIDWHPYPETKPDLYKPVLVTLFYSDGYEVVDIDELHFSPSLKKKERWGFERPGRKITAWAELPEPYCPKEPEDMHPDAITARKYMSGDPETIKALSIFDE